MLGLIGITDVQVVYAEGLAMGRKDVAMTEAKQAVDGLVERL